MVDVTKLGLIVLVFHLSSVLSAFPQLNHVKSKTSGQVQQQAASDLISRLVGAKSSHFHAKINPSLGPQDKDTFRLSSLPDGDLVIEGTTGVAVAMGFYHYLKYWCNAQRTWAGQQTQLPDKLPVLPEPVVITTNDKFRYYKNVCTESYTFAFWQWDRWEQEIDWMALHGINLPLAFTGQEAIFQRVYMNLGLTMEELNEFFGGPGFLAWARMGNIRGWGGPLPQMWITNQLLLQHQVLQRMRSLGMIPVLPAFAGFVPQNITRVFPKANVTRSSAWGHFNSTYTRDYLLNFHDPLYEKIGATFIQEMTREYGTNHIYNADTFNEMSPASSEPTYLASASRAVFNGMAAGDSQAVWLMQGWLFGNEHGFWTPERAKALLTAVPLGRMIILDLASEVNPIYTRYESYYGQPFIWCMIHNFGGINQLYGAVDSINMGPFEGRKFPNSSMIGIGLTPEGIHQNEVMYEFMMENSWRTEPRNATKWVKTYALQRYGANNTDVAKAWTTLMATVYNCKNGHHGNNRAILIRRPSVQNSFSLWYRPSDLFSAWAGFIKAAPELKESKLFLYDLTDVTRNSLQVIFLGYYLDILTAFQENDTARVEVAGSKMGDLLTDLDKILCSNDRFLLGNWLKDAKSWATDGGERKLLEYNARMQITLWGPQGEIVDYAGKQWAGVVADYYKPRWSFFTQWLVQLITKGKKFDDYIFDEHILNIVEAPWTLSQNSYPSTPSGDTVALANDLYAKYKPVTESEVFDKIYAMSQRQTKANSIISEDFFNRKYMSFGRSF